MRGSREGRMQPSTAQPAFEVFGVDAAEYQDVYLKAVSGSDCYGELLAEWYGSMCLSECSIAKSPGHSRSVDSESPEHSEPHSGRKSPSISLIKCIWW